MDKLSNTFYAKVRFNFDGRIIYKLIYVYNSFKRERSALPEIFFLKKEALFNRIAISLYNSLFGLSLSLNPMPSHELQNKFISFVLVEHY